MIYKYRLGVRTPIMLSMDVKFLDIQLQNNYPTLWVDTDPKQEQHTFLIHTFVTGAQPEGIYLRTLQVTNDLHFYYTLPA